MDNYLTPRQIAARLSTSLNTVFRLIKSGQLPAVRVSERVYRVPEADLEKFLRERAVVKQEEGRTENGEH